MNFLMAYLNAAERIENIVAGEHDQGPNASHKSPLVSKTKICWALLILTIAVPMAIFVGILQFFPSLMDISQDILNERKANKAANSESDVVQPPWTYNGNVAQANPRYPPPPMYPPPPITRVEYHPKAAFDQLNGEGQRNLPALPPAVNNYGARRPYENPDGEGQRNLPASTPAANSDYSARQAFENLNAERNPYDRYQQPQWLNPNYRIFQDLDHGAPHAAAVEESEEEPHQDTVRSSEKLQIDSADTELLLSKIDPNWVGKIAAFKKRMLQPST